MRLWQIVVAVLMAVILASFLATTLWQQLFNARLPSYVAGMVGGITSVFVWSFLQKHRVGRKNGGTAGGKVEK